MSELIDLFDPRVGKRIGGCAGNHSARHGQLFCGGTQ
jgi:hypothetical protein